MLVEDYLVAVVSLPAGVFQPYSGVKTSILILDRDLARRSDRIAFFKVEHDGYDLGAQRRPIDRNDLPRTAQALKEFLNMDGRDVQDADKASCPTLARLIDQGPALIVEKERIAESGDYNLSAERYREKTVPHSYWPTVELGQVCEIFNGITSRKSEYKDCGKVKVIKVRDFDESEVHFDKDERGWIDKEINTDKYLKNGDTLMINAAHSATHVASKIGFLDIEPPFKSLPSGEITIFRAGEFVLPVFLNAIVRSDIIRQSLKRIVKGIHIYPRDIKKIKVPLPPLDVQQEIVAEIESYQKVIDGARTVIDNYRPHIPIDSTWPMVQIGDVSSVESGFGFPKRYQGEVDQAIPFLKVSDMNLPGNEDKIEFWNNTVSCEILQELKARAFPSGTVIFPKIGAAIATNKKRMLTRRSSYDNNVMGIVANLEKLLPDFIYAYLLSFDLSDWASHAQPPSMRKSVVEAHKMPLPPLEIQRAIVAKIKVEQSLVNANRQLIQIFDQKIQTTIARIWND